MRFNPPFLAAGLLFSLTTLNAEAALTAYTSVGKNLVYSSLGGITWAADANLLGTLEAGNSNLVSTIISTIGSITDTPNIYDTSGTPGIHTLTTADFGSNGLVSWFGAQAFTKYLNTINYAGSNQWRLPSWTDTGAPGEQFGYSGTDEGFNVNTASGELAELYFDELGKTAYTNTSGEGPQPNFGILGTSTFSDTTGSAGPFSNVHTYAYWTGTEYASNALRAWDFITLYGSQNGADKYFQLYAWPVSPGQVSAVPVPGAVWLMGSGLLGLVSLKRRGYAG